MEDARNPHKAPGGRNPHKAPGAWKGLGSVDRIDPSGRVVPTELIGPLGPLEPKAQLAAIGREDAHPM